MKSDHDWGREVGLDLARAREPAVYIVNSGIV
jgi:hypothetical protein